MSHQSIAYLFVVLLSLCLQRVRTESGLEYLASRLCPYTNFCYKKAVEDFHDETNDLIPCCEPCLCGDECRIYGNCCPDEVTNTHITNSTNEVQLICSTTHVKKSPIASYPYTEDYIIVASCEYSDNADINDHKAGCEREDKHTLDDFVWVSDKVSGKIFKNWHCAVCTGVQDYIFWNIQTNCLHIFEENLANYDALLMSNSCHIILRPPEVLSYLVRKYICPSIDNFRCTSKMAGKLGEYAEVIAEACITLDWGFKADSSLWYQNVFCYACNKGRLKKVPLKCKTRQKAWQDRSPLGKFSLLLDYDSTRVLATNEQMEIQECSVGEIKDRYMNKCRTLYCPIRSVAYYGACENVMLRIGILEVNVSFYLKPLLEHPSLPDGGIGNDDEELSTAVYNRLHQILGFKEPSRCNYRTYTFWFDRREHASGAGFIFWANMYARDGTVCSVEYIFSQSVTAVSQNFDAEVKNETNVSLLINFEKRPYETIIAESDLLFYEKHQNSDELIHGIKTYRIQDTKVCPHVEIEYQEIYLVPVELASKLHSFFVDYDQVNTSTRARVCLEDYESVMSLGHMIRLKAFGYMVVMMIALIPVLCLSS